MAGCSELVLGLFLVATWHLRRRGTAGKEVSKREDVGPGDYALSATNSSNDEVLPAGRSNPSSTPQESDYVLPRLFTRRGWLFLVLYTLFLLFVCVPSYFLFGVHDRIKDLFNIATREVVVEEFVSFEGVCRQTYSTLGINVTGEIELSKATLTRRGVLIDEPEYAIEQQVVMDRNVYRLLGLQAEPLGEVGARADYALPDRISLSLPIGLDERPRVERGATTLEAEGEFDVTVVGATDSTTYAVYQVPMLCDVTIADISAPAGLDLDNQ